MGELSLERLMGMLLANQSKGLGEETLMPKSEEEDLLAQILKGRSLDKYLADREKYTLDPSMGKQRLRTDPNSYGPGGGGVFYGGGSPFKVDKTDQRILAQGAFASAVLDALSGAKEDKGESKLPAPKRTGTIEDIDPYTGNYPTGVTIEEMPGLLRELDPDYTSPRNWQRRTSKPGTGPNETEWQIARPRIGSDKLERPALDSNESDWSTIETSPYPSYGHKRMTSEEIDKLYEQPMSNGRPPDISMSEYMKMLEQINPNPVEASSGRTNYDDMTQQYDLDPLEMAILERMRNRGE